MTLEIPDIFYKVKYDYERYPGVGNQSDLSLGANCQVFSYELLAANGVKAPNLRSSNFWEDIEFTERVNGDPEPLDLLLFNNSTEPYGAHMAVSLGGQDLIHLSKKNVIAEISTISELCKLDRYRIYIGAKRVRR